MSVYYYVILILYFTWVSPGYWANTNSPWVGGAGAGGEKRLRGRKALHWDMCSTAAPKGMWAAFTLRLHSVPTATENPSRYLSLSLLNIQHFYPQQFL